MSKRVAYPTKDIELPGGGWVYWSERKGLWVPALCPVCKKRHLVRTAQALKAKYRGLHLACRKRRGDRPVGKFGSIFHLDIPNPANPDERAVTCGLCGVRWYTTPTKWKLNKGWRGKAWQGLCLACRPRERTNEATLPKGTQGLYHTRAAGDHKRVAIKCRGCVEKTKILKYVQMAQG